MSIKTILIFLAAAFISALYATTMLLKDSTRVSVTIKDTAGENVIVRGDSSDIPIRKKQIQWMVAGSDTVFFASTGQKPGSGKPPGVSIHDEILKLYSRYPVKKMAIESGHRFAWQKHPVLAGGAEEKNIAAFSGAMESFLKQQGPVHRLSKEGMYFFLRGDTVCTPSARYLAALIELSVRVQKREMSVQSFVKLDPAGNFTPSKTGTTYAARETETTVRFIVIDLREKAIVFNERLVGRDKGLQSLDRETSGHPRTKADTNCILAIENKIEALLLRQFK